MSRGRRRIAHKRQAADRAASRKFWGVAWPADPETVRMSSNPAAMMISLGDPPLRVEVDDARKVLIAAYRASAVWAFAAATAAGLDEQERE
ncbi:MAG: hypothetical protein RLZZ31_965 [Actinomycetota bacterium]